MPIVYCYDDNTKIFTGTQECQRDPLESRKVGHDVWLMPAHATVKAPPAPQEGNNIVWNGENWEYQAIPDDTPPEYVPTPLEKAQSELEQLLYKIQQSDHYTLKYIDGEYTDEEYAPLKAERTELRDQIRAAQAKVEELKKEAGNDK